MNINFKNLYEFNLAKSLYLLKISQPLKANYGIEFLSYRRFYTNGKLVYLINNQDWMNFSFEKGWINSESFHKRLSCLCSKEYFHYIWPNKPPNNDSIYSALYSLNIWNGIALYKKYDDCIEVFVFSSTNSPDASYELYLNNLFVLDRFILYAREKIFHLTEDMNNRCFLKHNVFNNSDFYSDNNFSEYCEQTKYKKFYLRVHGKEISLSTKEAECLSLLSQGKTIKEAARVLNLSPRTVETHINNAKIKTDLYSTSTLIDIFFKEKQKYQI